MIANNVGAFGGRLKTALREQIRPAVTIFVLLALITGIVYPLAVTAVSQIAFPDEANGSLIYDDDGNVIGSTLIGQYVDETEHPELFWPRPSAVDYDASTSGGYNLGPSSEELAELIQHRIDTLKQFDPDNTDPIPSDLVTASASGLDPHISYAAALYQMHRVQEYQANEGNILTDDELQTIINESTYTDALGNSLVNVLLLNLNLEGIHYTVSNGSPDSSMLGGIRVADMLLVVILIIILVPSAYLLSKFITGMYDNGERTSRIFGRIERPIYSISGVKKEGMTWKTYLLCILLFNLFGFLLLFFVLLFQGSLPMNPKGFDGLDPYLAFNTAVSFVTNTNWQAYGGETTMSLFSQMFGLTVQNFMAAATGITVLIALIRGIRNRSVKDLGNFWSDVTKATLILLPLAFIMSLVFVSQGVPQTLDASVQAALSFPYDSVSGTVSTQTISIGPVASQEAIKLFGTNGGGFMNANSSHPFENPNSITNLLQMYSILLIPFALCLVFGNMIKDRRQGVAILAVMSVIFVIFASVCIYAEMGGNPVMDDVVGTVSQASGAYQYGGNLEGKDLRFGTAGSSLYSIVTTATSCGSVDSMHDSYTSLGGMSQMLMMQLGEVCFGGVGSGLYGMLAFIIIAVFIAGLMIGKMPEYLGKKIGPREMKLCSAIIILPVMFILSGTAVAILWPGALDSLTNTGAHGFSELLYAFTSASANNGSAFAGLNANTPFYNVALAVCMMATRFGAITLTMALAGSLSEKKSVPPSVGTLPTHTPTFAFWLFGVVMIVGLLSFFLAISLGPLAEMMM